MSNKIDWSKWGKTVELVLYNDNIKTNIKVPAKLANDYVDEHHDSLLHYLRKQLDAQYINLYTRIGEEYPTVYTRETKRNE